MPNHSEWVRARRHAAMLPYLLMLPALLLLAGMIYPFCLGVYYSLTSYFLQYPHLFRFIGLGNYLKLPGDPLFVYSVKFTLAYTAVAVLIQVSLGIGVALLLHGRIIGRGVLRAMMLMPLMMPPVITALMWKVMMASTKAGILNHLLGLVGLGPVNWLGSVNAAMVSVLIIDTWGNLPFVSLILLGGLQSLPYEPYEAAVVDGAGGWDVLRYITLPLLKPFIILATTFRIMDSLRIFDVIYATTVGGPADATMNLHMRAFYYAFQWYQMGMGMAYAMVLLALVFIASYVLMRYWRRAAEQTEL
jgi:multiple sugar transport system permease protein